MRTVLAGTLLVLMLAAAGCGGGSSPSGSTTAAPNGEASKPARQVLADAVKAAKAASAVYMSGHLTTGPHEDSIGVTFEKGKGATGSITDNGLKVDIVVIGNYLGMQPNNTKVYLRASSAFWADWGPAAGITDASSLSGKWVEFSPTDIVANSALGPFAELADVEWIVGFLTSNMGALTKDVMTYKGQSVIAIDGPSKIRQLDVAATGTPYPVLIAMKGSAPASVSFDNWGKSVSLTAPSGAVDVAKLGG